MIQTKIEVVQEILYEVYGGITSSDVRLSERFVLGKVNNKIASLAVVNAYQLTNVEGITYADDFFYITFEDIPVLYSNNTGFYYFKLPAQPIGLPRERSFNLYPSKTSGCTGMDSTLFKMMPRHEVQRRRSLPNMNKVYCFIQDFKMHMLVPDSMPVFNVKTINLVIASADGGLDSQLNLPQDMIDTLKKSKIGRASCRERVS